MFEAAAARNGIRYPSRTFPGGENIALFERCRDAFAEADLGPTATWRSDAGDLDIAEILEAEGWGLV